MFKSVACYSVQCRWLSAVPESLTCWYLVVVIVLYYCMVSGCIAQCSRGEWFVQKDSNSEKLLTYMLLEAINLYSPRRLSFPTSMVGQEVQFEITHIILHPVRRVQRGSHQSRLLLPLELSPLHLPRAACTSHCSPSSLAEIAGIMSPFEALSAGGCPSRRQSRCKYIFPPNQAVFTGESNVKPREHITQMPKTSRFVGSHGYY